MFEMSETKNYLIHNKIAFCSSCKVLKEHIRVAYGEELVNKAELDCLMSYYERERIQPLTDSGCACEASKSVMDLLIIF